MCKRQCVMTSAHYNVGFLGMAIILSICVSLILLNQSLEKLWSWILQSSFAHCKTNGVGVRGHATIVSTGYGGER
jgi:hypothetical protein